MSDKKTRNLSALQADDAGIYDIADEVAHVEVYKFDPASAKWDKMGVAGTGFIVLRTNDPKYRFQVLNKSGIDNFTMDVDKISKIKEQAPYIMVKCTLSGAPVILGLWVHDENERGQLLRSLSAAKDGTLNAKPTAASPVKLLKGMLKSPVAAPVSAPLSGKGKVTKSPAPQQQQQQQVPSYKEATAGAVFLTDREISGKKGKGQDNVHTPPGGRAKVAAVSFEDSMQMFHAGAGTGTAPTTPSQVLLKSIIKPTEASASANTGPCLLLSPSDITGIRRKFLKTDQ